MYARHLFRRASIATGLLLALGGTHSALAQTACKPTGGYDWCQAFPATGSDQSYTVPTGVTSIHIQAWGAGGGGSAGVGAGKGGGGGYAYGDLAVTPGQTLILIVGKGGYSARTNSSTLNPSYGGGGSGGVDTSGSFRGGSGGGRSAIQLTAGADLLTAGGGGEREEPRL